MGNGSMGNRQIVHGFHGSTLQAVDSARKVLVGVRWDRVLRIRGLLAQGAYNVSSACVSDAILRRASAAV